MSLPSGAYVYTGPWINRSKGLVLGSTITLTERNGSLLTAFLGIFVTFAGAAFWRIISFLIHQSLANAELTDAAHHQQQAILRNSSTSGTAAWQLIQIVWSWRKINKRIIWHGIPLIILAICNMIIFAVAGVFSAEVTKAAGNETLIRSPNCGFLLPELNGPADSFEGSIGLNALAANDTIAATAYSRACYGDVPGGSQCYQYAKPNIPWKQRTNIPCPFGDGICKDDLAFEMDTGFINSRDDLGVNTRDSDQMEYRKLTTCSILQTKGYFQFENVTSSSGSVQEMLRYYYTNDDFSSRLNYTFQYNLNDATGSSGYALTPYFFSPDMHYLIPALTRDDADVTLMFLATNDVTYYEPVYDPWFRATSPFNLTLEDGQNITHYTQDFYVNVLACTDQYQIRVPALDRQTALTSASNVTDYILDFGLSDLQKAMVIMLYSSTLWQSTYYSVKNRGATALRASDTLDQTNLIQVALPDNQWTFEAAEMFSISMAKFQQQIINYATGPAHLHVDTTFETGDPDLCDRQRIRGIAGYTSFSVLGVAIILTVGTALILTNLVLDTVIGFIRRKMHWKDYKRLQWAVDDKLQLQRLAFEGAGQGRWTGGVNTVPITSDSNPVFGFRAQDVDAMHPKFAESTTFSRSSGEGGTDGEAWSKMAGAQITESRAS